MRRGNIGNTFGGSKPAASKPKAATSSLQLYSLTKLVADVTSKSVVSGTSTGKSTVSRSREVNSTAVAQTKTTTSIKRTIPSAREEQPKRKNVEDGQRHLSIVKKSNDWRAHDYWERFRDSKLEKMRLHKLNVEQRMRDTSGEGDNYNYYWDNINHCYSNQTHPRARGHLNAAAAQANQQNKGGEHHQLPASWYTDNIYSNWSIDLEDVDGEQQQRRDQNGNLIARDRRSTRHGLSVRNSCDINGNSPYKMHSLHGFDFEEAAADIEDAEDVFNNNNSYLVDNFRVHLQPTTPTKYGGSYAHSNRTGCALANNNSSADEDGEDVAFGEAAAATRNHIRRGIPKSKSFGQEGNKTRGRFSFGSSFLWQGRRSKTTNLLADLQSKFRRDKREENRFSDENNGDSYATLNRNLAMDKELRRNIRTCDNGNGNEEHALDYDEGGCDRMDCRVEECQQQQQQQQQKRSFGNRFANGSSVLRNRSMDDEIYRRRSRFNFQQNLLLNSEDEEDSDFGCYTMGGGGEFDQNNNPYRSGIGDPSEAYYHHQETIDRPPIRPTTLNLHGRFARGRSLDDYEYGTSHHNHHHRTSNLNYIDKNLNIVNFLNSARNIPQEFHGEDVAADFLTEQIFNPSVEYRPQATAASAKSKINRMRNFSSLDLDWETADIKGNGSRQGILERTSAIFGNLINSPGSSSMDEIALASAGGADNDIVMCPVIDGADEKKSYLNFISDPEPMPKKSCMKKPATTMTPKCSDFVLHHPQQALDYKLNSYYPQEEFNETSLMACHSHHHPMDSGIGVGGVGGIEDPDLILDEHDVDLEEEELRMKSNLCASLNNNTNNILSSGSHADANNLGHLQSNPFELNSDEEAARQSSHHHHHQHPLDPNTLHIINNIFSIYKPNQYSPVNCHNPQQDDPKVNNYCKKISISLPSTMRPLGEPMAGQCKIDMDDEGYLLNGDHNNNNSVPMHDAYDDCFAEGPSAVLGGNRRRKSTFFASMKRPLMVVKSKSCHDAVATSDDHWFCSGDLSGGNGVGGGGGGFDKWHKNLSSSTNLLNALTSPTDSNNSLLEKTGLFKFSPTSTTETSYFYPFDYYFNAGGVPSTGHHHQHHTGTKKKSLMMLRSTSRPLSFSH